MAEAFEGTWSQDRHVSRQNLRHEKHLKKQLDVLEKERSWKTKSLAADKRCFEEKVHRLNMNPTERAHLSKDTNVMMANDKKKELDRLLKSLLHRPYETRAGYSYIEYLSRNMQPLVKRPLQWGVNPPLYSPRMRLPVDACQATSEQKPSVFLTRIEGQTVSLKQRVSLPVKRREKFKPEQIVLPPIRGKVQNTKTVIPELKSPTQDWKRKETFGTESQTTRLRKKPESKYISVPEKNTEERTEADRILASKHLGSREKTEENTEKVPKEKDVLVSMARLDVPTPNYYQLELPTINDETLRDDHDDETSTPELESHSQIYYTFTVGVRDNRRKSI